MEVKIGVLHSPRELVVESALSQDQIQAIVADALAATGGVLSLDDEKGRRVIIPTTLVSYVEIAQPDVRKVGFGT